MSGMKIIFLYKPELEERIEERMYDVELQWSSEIFKILTAWKRFFPLYRPGVVFHAAAYKHVPMMEDNIDEAIKNNIYGTRNVADIPMRLGQSGLLWFLRIKLLIPPVSWALPRVAELISNC